MCRYILRTWPNLWDAAKLNSNFLLQPCREAHHWWGSVYFSMTTTPSPIWRAWPFTDLGAGRTRFFELHVNSKVKPERIRSIGAATWAWPDSILLCADSAASAREWQSIVVQRWRIRSSMGDNPADKQVPWGLESSPPQDKSRWKSRSGIVPGLCSHHISTTIFPPASCLSLFLCL